MWLFHHEVVTVTNQKHLLTPSETQMAFHPDLDRWMKESEFPHRVGRNSWSKNPTQVTKALLSAEKDWKTHIFHGKIIWRDLFFYVPVFSSDNINCCTHDQAMRLYLCREVQNNCDPMVFYPGGREKENISFTYSSNDTRHSELNCLYSKYLLISRFWPLLPFELNEIRNTYLLIC